MRTLIEDGVDFKKDRSYVFGQHPHGVYYFGYLIKPKPISAKESNSSLGSCDLCFDCCTCAGLCLTCLLQTEIHFIISFLNSSAR